MAGRGDDDRVALITGASSGFGLLTSIELAKAGFRVYGTMRDPSRRQSLDEAAASAGVTVEVERLDVTDQASIDTAVGAVRERHGHIDVLVNNAGYGIGGFFETLSMEEIREQFETNFFGALAVTQAVVPGMRERRSGRIINLSSLAGRMGQPAMTAYVSSKWALEGFSESLRFELLPFGVHVVLVEPGMFRTSIFAHNRRVAAAADDPASPYYRSAKRLEAYVDRQVERSADDPIKVARVIARAATCRKPAMRYLVGKDARVLPRVRALAPFGIYERAVVRIAQHRADD